MAGDARKPVTAEVWGRFLRDALVWMIPALLVLPILLALLAISMVAADGGLLEAGEGKIKGGLGAALGPLLILVGVAAGVLTAIYATELADYGEGGFFALICVGVGIAISVRELRRLAKKA